MLLSRILPEAARLHPDHIVMKSKNEILTYKQLWQQVSRISYGLHELTIKPGDRIALLGNPSPRLAAAECAVVAIGALPIVLFPSLMSSELRQILQDATPAAIIYDSALPNISETLSSIHNTKLITIQADHTLHSLHNFIAHHPLLDTSYEAHPDDVALIIYTGGTTGRSKGVMHTHRGIRQWAFMKPELGGGHLPAKMAVVPNQAHLTGQFILWTTLFEGGCLIYPDSYPLQAEEVIEIIEREQIKFLGTVGLLFRDIVHTEHVQSRCSSLERITCGGAPMSERTFRKAREVLPNVQLIEVYSQTESGQFISFLSVDQCYIDDKPERLLSVGNPAHMSLWGQNPFDIRIVDESDNDVSLGEIGEIIVRSDQMMLGYWNNPEQTNETLRSGWLHTGDIGRFDADGYLYLLDRKKDIIIVGASNVYCSEVEDVLSKHPSIAELAIIGTPLPEEGEEVTALMILRLGCTLSLDQISEFCHDQLAAYKIPTRLEIVQTLPRTSVGKMNKAEIKRSFWSGSA